MRLAETVTFGGSGLDRAAQARGDAARQAALWQDRDARVAVLWRGKPLLAGSSLAWLATGHAALADMGERLFLGVDDKGPLFAADLSGWEPDEGA